MTSRINRQRPFFLNLMAIRLPIGGIVSILHRASGAGLSLAVPLLLFLFSLSLRSPYYYERITGLFSNGLGWLIGLGLLWALLHHCFAGMRHLGFDFGLGEGKERARQTAWLTLVLAVVLVGLVALASLLGGGA